MSYLPQTNLLTQHPIIVYLLIIALAIIVFVVYFSFKPKKRIPLVDRHLTGEISTAESQKQSVEIERLQKALFKKEEDEIFTEIEKMADEKINTLLPDKLPMLDPDNNLVGRPLFFMGGIPVHDKNQELSQLLKDNTLAKIFPYLAEKYYNWLYFGAYNTLFFYTTTYLPNGKWAIVATSKPARKTGKHFKLPFNVKTFVLIPTQQSTIDSLIANKWEVTQAKASIMLSSTFLGAIPSELLSKHFKQVGWENVT
ncbi:MAG: hypothetical protein WC196_06145 [Bacilli bacterium]|jgi:hypothetical protein